MPGLMGIWQKRIGIWANTQIKVNPTQVYEQMGHPVILKYVREKYRKIQRR